MAAYFSNSDNKVIYSTYVGIKNDQVDHVAEISSVFVDGHELNHAEKLLDRKVPDDKRSFTFFGDDAKTIFSNW